jgi:hypothetical protein
MGLGMSDSNNYTSESSVDSPFGKALTAVRNLSCIAKAAPGANNSWTVMVRSAHVDKGLTCSISGAAATACQDNTHSFSQAADVSITLNATTTGTPSTIQPLSCMVELDI